MVNYCVLVIARFHSYSTKNGLFLPLHRLLYVSSCPIQSYLGRIPLTRFPLPTTPSPVAVEAAECRLVALGALEELPQAGSSGECFN